MASGLSFTPEGIAERVGVHKTKLGQECSQEHVKEISLFLKSWKTLAPHLDLKDTDIEDIDLDRGMEQVKKLKTLQKWKDRFIHLATYKVLIEAMLKIGNAGNAREVCYLLNPALGCPGNTEPTATTPSILESLPSSANAAPHLELEVASRVPPITSTTVDVLQGTANPYNSIEDELNGLEKEFFDLVDQAEDDIEKAIERTEVKLDLVKDSITNSLEFQTVVFQNMPTILSDIKQAKSINEILCTLGLKYWHYMKCELLKVLVDSFGRKETQEWVQKYLMRLINTMKELNSDTTRWHIAPLPKKPRLQSSQDEQVRWMDSTLHDKCQDTPPGGNSRRRKQHTVALLGSSTHSSMAMEKISSEIEELEDEFSELAKKAAGDIETKVELKEVSFSQVKRNLTLLSVSIRESHRKFLDEKQLDIEGARDVDGLFHILKDYWSFLNCGLLENFVKSFGSQATQQLMESYMKRLKDFRVRTTVRMYTAWTYGIPTFINLDEFIEVKGAKWMDCSLEEVEIFQISKSRQHSLNNSFPLVYRTQLIHD